MRHLIAVATEKGSQNYIRALGFTEIYSSVAEYRQFISKHSKTNILFLTGTSFGLCPEKYAIRTSIAWGCPSVGIIDHWSWYRKRFETPHGLLMPDKILVNDEVAYCDAVADGLPKERLVALGNPVLELASLRSGKWESRSLEIRQKFRISSEYRIIVFISEELASDFKPDTGDHLGYDEFVVVKQLLKILKVNDCLTIKLHPGERFDKYAFLQDRRVSVIRDATVEELASLGDIIIGMGSMLLLELAMFRNDIISFRPAATKSFVGAKLGATVDVQSLARLREAIERRLTVESDFRQRFVGSSERISRFLEEMAA